MQIARSRERGIEGAEGVEYGLGLGVTCPLAMRDLEKHFGALHDVQLVVHLRQHSQLANST